MASTKVLKNVILKRLNKFERSQGWLSRQTKLEYHHVNKIVNGHQVPLLTTAFRIAKALRCKVDDLWKY